MSKEGFMVKHHHLLENNHQDTSPTDINKTAHSQVLPIRGEIKNPSNLSTQLKTNTCHLVQ